MRRRFPLLAAAVAVLVLPMLAAGCTERGGETPRETWELSVRYVENEEYGKLWSLFTRRFQRELGEMFAVQKQTVRQERQERGDNTDQTRALIEAQYGLGLDAFLAASNEDLHARMVERGRERILRMRLRSDPVVEGDRAKLKVELDEPGTTPTTFEMVKDGGRWLIDGTDAVPGRRGPGLPATGR